MELHVKNNGIVKVSGDKTHPANFGRLCTKGATSSLAVAAPGRLDSAYIHDARVQDLVHVPMERAIAETGRRLAAIRDAHGADAISFYISGGMSIESQYLVNKLAKGFVRTNNIESNSRFCVSSAASGYKLSLGADGPPGSYQDMDKADLFFIIDAKADLYLPIKPGGDIALLNGLLYLLHEAGRVDLDFIAAYTDGWNRLAELIDD